MIAGSGFEGAVHWPLWLLPSGVILPGWSSLILIILGAVGGWCSVFKQSFDHLSGFEDINGPLSVLAISSKVRGGKDFFHHGFGESSKEHGEINVVL